MLCMLKAEQRKGSIVTNAKGGESIHNYELAFDIVPLKTWKTSTWGQRYLDLKLWKDIAKIDKACGLEWAGDWRNGLQKWHTFNTLKEVAIKDLER